jgi:hypothetical protein
LRCRFPDKATDGLPLPAIASESNFQLWSIVPVTRNGWAFQGEVDKWVGVSAVRFPGGVEETDSGLAVRAHGQAGETMTVGFVSPSGAVTRVQCTFPDLDAIRIESDGSCL